MLLDLPSHLLIDLGVVLAVTSYMILVRYLSEGFGRDALMLKLRLLLRRLSGSNFTSESGSLIVAVESGLMRCVASNLPLDRFQSFALAEKKSKKEVVGKPCDPET